MKPNGPLQAEGGDDDSAVVARCGNPLAEHRGGVVFALRIFGNHKGSLYKKMWGWVKSSYPLVICYIAIENGDL